MIGIGVLGHHLRSRHGLEVFARTYPGAVVRAVAQDPQASPVLLEGHGGPAEVRRWAETLGGAYCPDYRTLLARDDIQLISLMCEPARAPALVAEAAAAGKHILSDKPLAGNVSDAQRIVAAVRRHGVELLVGFSTRYAPAFRRAAELIHGGELGDVLALRVTYCFGGKPEGFTASPEFVRNFGGGDLTIAGCYAVDLVRWLTGREATHVFARTGAFFFPDYRGVMEDLGQVSLTVAGGLPATILSGRLAARGRTIELDVTGTKGEVRVTGDTAGIEVQGDPSRWEPVGPSPPQRMVHDFLHCLETGRPSPIPPEDGLAAVRVLQAAYESAAAGAVVPV